MLIITGCHPPAASCLAGLDLMLGCGMAVRWLHHTQLAVQSERGERVLTLMGEGELASELDLERSCLAFCIASAACAR